jgi:hypothetical protein
MISLHHRSKFTFSLMIVLLFLGLGASCYTEKPGTESGHDPRAELIRSLKGANIEGFNFAIDEDETQVIASLTSNAVRDVITLKGDTTMALRYTSIKDRKTNTVKTYKAEVVKKGAEVALVVSDIATGEIIDKIPPPPPPPTPMPTGICAPPAIIFDSLNACIDDFNCKKRPAILCEVNKTCKPQRAGVTCCIKGQPGAIIVDMLITPTSFRCLVVGPLPDQLELVLSP